MTSPTHRAECSAAALYVGIELSLREWLLTLGPGPAAGRMRVRVRPGDRAAVVDAITRATARFGLPPAAPVRSCYEAGRDGFWPHRFLTTLGVDNLVVDSSSIEVPRRRRRAKTDRIDGEKLLHLLLRHWGGERQMWQVVHVPAPAREDARHASRSLTTLQRERTRCRNRIHGLLALHGVRLRVDARSRPGWRRPVIGRARRCRPGCRRGCSRRGGSGKPWRRSGGRSGPPSSSRCGRPRRRCSRWRSA